MPQIKVCELALSGRWQKITPAYRLMEQKNELLGLEEKTLYFCCFSPCPLRAISLIAAQKLSMSIEPRVQQYLDFMQWFEQHYPSLHADYWTNIGIPQPGKKIQLVQANMEVQAIVRIEAVIKDYYNFKK